MITNKTKYDALNELLERKKAEESFYEFSKQAWHLVEGDNTPFIDGVHIHAICDHLQAVVERKIRFLLGNLPPRCTKSTLLSVMLCPWVWIDRPDERFLYASYAFRLSVRDSIRSRRIIESDWYQSRWGDRYFLSADQNTKDKFENSKGGYRLCASQNSSVTGDGGSILVIDDGNNAKDLDSDIIRESRNNWYDAVWSTRLNNPAKDCRIVMQQRIHEQDITGHILSNEPEGMWTKLILPMEYESQRKCKTVIDGKVWEDPRTVEGELLWPERIGVVELAQLKAGLGSTYRIAGQLQQRPAPEGGGIIKAKWFRWWKYSNPPKILHVIQSWDTALGAKDSNCFSACTTWGLFHDENEVMNLILLSLWRGKLEYPELRKMAQRLYRNYLDDNIDNPKESNIRNVPDIVLIEAKSSGISLIQDLMKAGITATKFDPDRHGDKILRVRLITHFLETGRVWLPAKPPDYLKLRDYAQLMAYQCSIFPNAESRDLVDTMTQVLLRLRDGGYLTNPLDEGMFDVYKKQTTTATEHREGYY